MGVHNIHACRRGIFSDRYIFEYLQLIYGDAAAGNDEADFVGWAEGEGTLQDGAEADGGGGFAEIGRAHV